MDVKEFLSETLKQIVDGILDAQEQTKNKGAVVVPHGGSEMAVRFDIAVVVAEGTETCGSSSLQVYENGSSADGKSDSSNSIVSRVQFEVPIEYPYGEESPTFGDDL